jgi:hypothetical protein
MTQYNFIEDWSVKFTTSQKAFETFKKEGKITKDTRLTLIVFNNNSDIYCNLYASKNENNNINVTCIFKNLICTYNFYMSQLVQYHRNYIAKKPSDIIYTELEDKQLLANVEFLAKLLRTLNMNVIFLFKQTTNIDFLFVDYDLINDFIEIHDNKKIEYLEVHDKVKYFYENALIIKYILENETYQTFLLREEQTTIEDLKENNQEDFNEIKGDVNSTTKLEIKNSYIDLNEFIHFLNPETNIFPNAEPARTQASELGATKKSELILWGIINPLNQHEPSLVKSFMSFFRRKGGSSNTLLKTNSLNQYNKSTSKTRLQAKKQITFKLQSATTFKQEKSKSPPKQVKTPKSPPKQVKTPKQTKPKQVKTPKSPPKQEKTLKPKPKPKTKM